MKRAVDIVLASLLLLALSPVFVLTAVLVKLTSSGPVLYWSQRIGRDNATFSMPKFRTMRTGTPVLPTHLLDNAASYLTPIGSLLRRSSLDELPQLLSILAGHMSFVGPRPALFNQDDLVELRTRAGVHRLVPGLTGWAQINGRDELSIAEKVRLDVEYLERQSLLFDFRVLWLTLIRVVRSDGVAH